MDYYSNCFEFPPIFCCDSAYKSLLIILITFFDLTKIRKVTAGDIGGKIGEPT